LSPASHHGHLDDLTKSPFSFERYDAGWEREYMEELENDPDVEAWTKEHGIRIPYVDSKSITRGYRPDFLVRMGSGGIELHEVKGGHLIENPTTKKKFEAAKRWCEARGITFVVVTKE
jgi:hypothetical protein